MILLLDTQLLFWAAGYPERPFEQAHNIITEPRNQLWFSTASL